MSSSRQDQPRPRTSPGPARTGQRPGRTGSPRILVGMSKRVVVAGAAWVLLTVLAFLRDPILGAFVLVFGGIGVAVVALGSTYDQHPDFEARELARARRRKAKRERHQERN